MKKIGVGYWSRPKRMALMLVAKFKSYMANCLLANRVCGRRKRDHEPDTKTLAFLKNPKKHEWVGVAKGSPE